MPKEEKMNYSGSTLAIGWDVGGWSGKNHGICILEAKETSLTLLEAHTLDIYRTKELIEKYLADYHKTHLISIGIDAPLSFPKLFQQVLQESPLGVFDAIKEQPKTNPMAWRGTDLFIKEKFRKTPLSPSFSFLSSNATVAITLLGELREKYPLLTLRPTEAKQPLKVMEVYPGLLKSTKIQQHSVFNQYQQLLYGSVFSGITGFDYYFKGAKEKSDLADGAICALYALGATPTALVPSLELRIPHGISSEVVEEGWIYYPKLD